MCWSGEASAVLAGIGIGSTAYAAIRKEPAALWVTLGYFSLMEVLQAYTYLVIDQCGNPANQIATLLGYLHIVFQPFFGNALSMHLIPKTVRERIALPVYGLCFVSAIVMLIQIYPFSWAGRCEAGSLLCGPSLCSVSGSWHIAWEIPTNGLGNGAPSIAFYGSGFPTYAAVMFLLPLLYGSWRVTLYHLLVGPTLARALTSSMTEYPAVWCLLSIGMLLLVVKTPLRRILFVRTWPLWWSRLRRSQAGG
jgi:hypothetical protein